MKKISIERKAELIGSCVERMRAACVREPGFFKAFVLSSGILLGLSAGRKHMLRCTVISSSALVFSGMFLLYKAKNIDAVPKM